MDSMIVPAGATGVDTIKDRILEIRGQRVMLDRDLAALYGVETKRLNEAVKRNINRFPEDFMFVLTDEEWLRLRSQFATSNDSDGLLGSQNATSKRGGTRYRPYAFTEYGVAMLSSVLRSETAIQVNINIMRAFIAIRHAVAAMQTADFRYEQLSHKMDQLNAYVEEILHDQNDINEQQERTNQATDLAHEMFHALDANQGLLDHREEKGIPRKDWQAVYRENILRGQMGLPLRTHFGKVMSSNGEFVGGRGERMTSEGKPIRPSWY